MTRHKMPTIATYALGLKKTWIRCAFSTSPAGTFKVLSGVRLNSAFHVSGGEPIMSPPEKNYTLDNQRRLVYTWRNKSSPPPVDSVDWFMETEFGSQSSPDSNRYRFMNVLTKEYLYSDSDRKAIDESRRRLLTAPGPKNPLFGNQRELWDVIEIPRNCSCKSVYHWISSQLSAAVSIFFHLPSDSG